jgi:hypothetical protein
METAVFVHIAAIRQPLSSAYILSCRRRSHMNTLRMATMDRTMQLQRVNPDEIVTVLPAEVSMFLCPRQQKSCHRTSAKMLTYHQPH